MTASRIEWTDRSDWNPIRGCTRVSEGCRNCYAEAIAARFSGPGHPWEGFAERTAKGPRWTGKVALVEDRLTLPLRWRKPERIFVNSASDIFHEDIPDDWIDRIFAVMALAPHHTFQLLTKRSKRMREYCSSTGERRLLVAKRVLDNWIDGHGRNMICDGDAYPLEDGRADDDPAIKAWPLPNVWLGVSVEDQARADERIPDLLATPAAVRWVSAEPLLGPIIFPGSWLGRGDNGLWPWSEQPNSRLDWVVVGGESGSGARPTHPAWARSLRDQCVTADVPFFFKQWGEYVDVDHLPDHIAEGRDSFDIHGRNFHRIGEKHAGRLLDGVEHNGMPEVSE